MPGDIPPAAASAASAAAASADATVAECFQAVETLTAMFGFDYGVANQAVNEVGTDITRCYNYILDQSLAQDGGGSVYPIDNCPHVKEHILTSAVDEFSLTSLFQDTPMMQLPCCVSPTTTATGTSTSTDTGTSTGGLKAEVAEDNNATTSCPLGENWLCLMCRKVFCSRYVNGHCVDHWKESGHCIAASFADLSVWCHECQSYIKDTKTLQPIMSKLEEIKFGNDQNATVGDNAIKASNNNNATATTKESPSLPSSTDKQQGSDYKQYAVTIKELPADEAKTGDVRSFQRNDHAEMRPPKRQRSFASSITSSDHTISSEDSSSNNNVSPKDDGDDSSFENEAKLRSFPISLTEGDDEDEEDEEDEEEESLSYPFESVPTSLQDVAKFIQSDACQKIVILAGAGMSVVSGIPDFRSANGLYATMDADSLTATQSEKDLIRFDPSIALDNRLFLQNQLPCLEVNRQFLLGTKDRIWKATLAHRFVELLHKKTKKLVRLYTQNIDGLEDQCTYLPRHKVVPVHGTMDQADCGMCHNEAEFEQFCRDVRHKIKDITGTDPTAPATSQHIPCRICGYNTLKPSIVLFKSNLPQRFFELMPRDVEDADLLLVIGTSLKVAPANSIVYRVPKTCLRVLVNRDPVGISLGMQYGPYAERDYFAEGDIDPTILELMTHLGWLDELEPLLEEKQLPESSADLLQQRLQEVKENTHVAP